MRRDVIAAAAVIALAWAVLSYPLAAGGDLSGLQDGWVHTLWAQQFQKGLAKGELYPRWYGDVNLGFGSASPAFYPPLSLYSYSLIGLVAHDAARAVMVSSALALLLSGASMYVFARWVLGPWAGLGAAVLYMALPYRMYSIYEKGALGEQWAFLWLPLILYFAHRMRCGGIRRGGIKAGAGLSVSYAGLALTHVPTTILFTPFAVGYVEALDSVRPAGERPVFYRSLLWLALGTALAAFYLLPAVLDQRHIHAADIIFDEYFYPWKHYLFTPGAGELNRRVSLMALCSLGVMAVLWAGCALRKGEGDDRDRVLPYVAALGAAGFILMTPLADAAWRHIGLMERLQFPWRLMVVETVFTALGAGWLMKAAAMGGGRTARLALGLALGLLLLWAGQLAIKTVRLYEPPKPLGQAYAISPSLSYDELRFAMAQRFDTPTMFNLIDVPEYKPALATHDLLLHERAVMAMKREGGLAYLAEGSGSVRVEAWEPEARTLWIQLDTPGLAVLRTYYHPYWRARGRGGPGGEAVPQEGTGFLALRLPPGRYAIDVELVWGPWFFLGVAVSLFAFAALAVLFIRGDRQRRGDRQGLP